MNQYHRHVRRWRLHGQRPEPSEVMGNGFFDSMNDDDNDNDDNEDGDLMAVHTNDIASSDISGLDQRGQSDRESPAPDTPVDG